MEFAAKLRLAIFTKNSNHEAKDRITPRSLSKQSNNKISTQRIRILIAGNTAPSDEEICFFAKTLQIPFDWLSGESDALPKSIVEYFAANKQNFAAFESLINEGDIETIKHLIHINRQKENQ